MSYFRVVAERGQNAAELYLYGIIGQEGYWWEEDYEEELTDLAVVRAIRSLEQEYTRINIRINSPGGLVHHGDAIISAILSSRAEIHAYNDGLAASMAADIWLCSPNRHMPMHAKLMLHNTSTFLYGHAKAMREQADILEKMDGISVSMLAKSTGMGEEEIHQNFYNYKDNFLSAKDCLSYNLISAIEEYTISADTPAAPERMSAVELLRHYGQKDQATQPQAAPPRADRRGFMSMIRQSLFGSSEPKVNQPVTPESQQLQANDMNIEELRRSLDDTSITEDQLLDLVRERGYTAERKATPETPPPAAVQEPVTPDPRYAEMERKLDDIMNMVRQQGQRPGAKPAAGAADGDVHDDIGNALEAYNKRMATAATTHETVRMTR